MCDVISPKGSILVGDYALKNWMALVQISCFPSVKNLDLLFLNILIVKIPNPLWV